MGSFDNDDDGCCCCRCVRCCSPTDTTAAAVLTETHSLSPEETLEVERLAEDALRGDLLFFKNKFSNGI